MSDPPSPITPESIQAMDQTLADRHTIKVMAAEGSSHLWAAHDVERCDQQVWGAIQKAGWAPFHYPAASQGPVEPWRVHWLKQPLADQLATILVQPSEFQDRVGKIPALLRGCGSVVLVTWLPESKLVDASKLEETNREHLLAVGGFVQSLLLALTARGLGSYWSSGGVLDQPTVRHRIKVADSERLAAAVFVDYGLIPVTVAVERVAGKQRERRSDAEHWSRVVSDLETDCKSE